MAPKRSSQRQQKIVRQSSLADDSIQLNQEAGVPKPLQYDPIDHPRGIRLLRLAQGGLEEDSKDKDGKTPLWRAAANGHDAVVKLLLDKERVDPDSKDAKYSGTPLWRAAADGAEAVVKVLGEKGAELQPTTAA